MRADRKFDRRVTDFVSHGRSWEWSEDGMRTIYGFELIGVGPQPCALRHGWLHVGGEEDVITAHSIINTSQLQHKSNSRFDPLLFEQRCQFLGSTGQEIGSNSLDMRVVIHRWFPRHGVDGLPSFRRRSEDVDYLRA